MTRISAGSTRRSFLALGAAAIGSLPRFAWAQPKLAPPPAVPKGQVIVGRSQEPTKFNPLLPAIEVDQGVWWNASGFQRRARA